MVTNNQLKELLNELKLGLQKLYGPRLKGLYLYGSYARGDFRQDSDVNVYVVLEDYERYNKEIERTSALTADLSLKFEVAITKTYAKERDWVQGITPFPYGIPEEAVAA